MSFPQVVTICFLFTQKKEIRFERGFQRKMRIFLLAWLLSKRPVVSISNISAFDIESWLPSQGFFSQSQDEIVQYLIPSESYVIKGTTLTSSSPPNPSKMRFDISQEKKWNNGIFHFPFFFPPIFLPRSSIFFLLLQLDIFQCLYVGPR